MLLWTATAGQMHFRTAGPLASGRHWTTQDEAWSSSLSSWSSSSRRTSPRPHWLGRAAFRLRAEPRGRHADGRHTPGWKPPSCCTRRGSGTRGALYASSIRSSPRWAESTCQAWKGPSSAASAASWLALGRCVILGVHRGVGSHLPSDGLTVTLCLAVLVAILLFRPSRALRRRVMGHVLLWGSSYALPFFVRSDFTAHDLPSSRSFYGILASRST